MRLVIIESPYAGDIEANIEYARAAMRDSLNRGEAPIASHLLYTQPGILRDEDAIERQWGIDAGLAWRKVAEFAAFYADRNWSGGMLAARKLYREERFPFEVRLLDGTILERFQLGSVTDDELLGGGERAAKGSAAGHMTHKLSSGSDFGTVS